MQFLLRFHRFRRLLNSATAALSSRIDAHTLAGPQRVFAFPQDVVSPASKASPEMSNYRRYRCTGRAAGPGPGLKINLTKWAGPGGVRISTGRAGPGRAKKV